MSDFHLLRPWWLVALLPVVWLGWRMWSTADSARTWRNVIAPHLLTHLLVGDEHRTARWPLWLLLAGWSLATIALAGPTWQREPAPFADDEAVLVIVLKVTPSMQTADIEPTRLARSVQKIHDLLQKRPGAKSALIAYSGSAHQVMPLTTDAGIVNSFAAELDPSVMPSEGDVGAAALQLADKIVQRSQQRGWILWIADAATTAPPKVPTPVTVLAVAGEGAERNSLAQAARGLAASVVSVTADDADVQRLAANTHFSAANDGTENRWQDAGYWLTPLIAALCLCWFRQGWVVQTETSP